MTGPEHYREAERLAADAEKFLDPCDAPSLAQTAQVHASLARTAAYVMSQPVRGLADEPGLEQEEMDDWYAAVNGLPPKPLLTEAERKFLSFALDQAAEEMSLGDGFTADDETALTTLRRIAEGGAR